MLFRNIKYAFRNLWRDKFYTLLNGLGLVIGLTVTLLIFMWIKDEMSYDSYHSKKGDIYYVLGNMHFAGEFNTGIRTPFKLAEEAREKVPSVQHIARTWQLWKPTLEYNNFVIDARDAFLAEPSIFEILDYEFIQGNPATALSDPKSIVISEYIAEKVFGKENPMGKTVQIQDKLELTITGILKNSPVNTHFAVDVFIPFESNESQFLSEGNKRWGSFNFSTFALLHPNSNPGKVAEELSNLVPLSEDQDPTTKSFFELHPIEDIHLNMEKVERGFNKGDWRYIQLFGLIGFIILLIAAINYINLTTARAAHKVKSTGVRKIVGATRSHLVGQHIIEAVCLVGICGILPLCLAQISLPYFKLFSGKAFTDATVFNMNTIGLAGLICLVTILLSGIQPALQLSAFKPIEMLRGSAFKGMSGKGSLRKVLVITQFIGSAALIICTIFMLRQMKYVQAAKLGYEKEHIFSFSTEGENSDLFLQTLQSQPGIVEVTKSSQSLVEVNNTLGGFTWEGMEGKQDLSITNLYAGDNFNEFFDLELKEGRWFHPERLDSFSYVINEAAVEMLNLQEPLGKWIDFWGSKGNIAGVIKDFHFKSLHNEIEPLIFLQSTNWFPTIYVKTTGQNAQQAIASAEKVFKQHQPKAIFKYEFLDERVESMYKKESRVGQLFLFFALIAIIISCLGIFGLATYTAEKRFKEIGIRKVLGASVTSIVQLLSKDFIKLVLLALIFAVPIAWYFMDTWLNNFSYRIELDWWVFMIAGLIAVGIALLTVGVQSLRAALSNPVDSIKNE